MRSLRFLIASLHAHLGRPLQPHDLDDVQQEVELVLWSKAHGRHAEHADVAWVFGVCRVQLLRTLERQRRGVRVDARLDPSMLAVPSALDSAESTRDSVRGALARLTPREREVIELRHFEACDFSEIAQRLALGVFAVKSVHYRALRRLRMHLEAAGPGLSGPERSDPEFSDS